MSFSRKAKRVAGPGFNINVRYDDNQVNKLKNNQNSAALISKGLRLKELWDVKEQELLVAMDSTKGANYFDGYTHCFSCANNWDGTSNLQVCRCSIDRICTVWWLHGTGVCCTGRRCCHFDQ